VPGDLDVAACLEEDVLEQQVAMRDALAVDVRDRRDDLLDDASNESVAVAHRRTEVRKQCVALRVLHHEISIQIIGQERVHVNDTGVSKLNDGAHLPVKARERLLPRDRALRDGLHRINRRDPLVNLFCARKQTIDF
jgi:hypothetical protein